MNNLLGIDKYYGMDDYNNNSDFDGVWGIWDDKFFAYCADKLTNIEEPFFSGIFSCSSHHPFKIPKEFKMTPNLTQTMKSKDLLNDLKSCKRFFESFETGRILAKIF